MASSITKTGVTIQDAEDWARSQNREDLLESTIEKVCDEIIDTGKRLMKEAEPKSFPEKNYVISEEELKGIIKTYENSNLPYKVVKAIITRLENLPTI